VRFHYYLIASYITLWSTIFPYQECNNTLPLAVSMLMRSRTLDVKIIVISTCNELTEAAKCFRKQRRALIYNKGIVRSDITGNMYHKEFT